MKRTFQDLRGYLVHARDGALGHVRDLVFSPQTWSVTFLAIDTRRWLAPRQALVSPHDVASVDLLERRIYLTLSRYQVDERPSLAAFPASGQPAPGEPAPSQLPWSHPWVSSPTLDAGISAGCFGPLMGSGDAAAGADLDGWQARQGAGRSAVGANVTAVDLVGCRVEFGDGTRCGHVSDVIIEGLSWSAPYFVVDSGPWYAGRKALVPMTLVREVDTRRRRIATAVTADRWRAARDLVQEELETLPYEEVVESLMASQAGPLPPTRAAEIKKRRASRSARELL